MKTEQSKLDKLPKDIQDYIKSLKRLIESQKDLIQSLKQHNPESNIFFKNLSGPCDNKVYLPKHTMVYFKLKSDSSLRSSINVYIKNNVLQIMGDRSLKILPKASNSIEIELGDN